MNIPYNQQLQICLSYSCMIDFMGGVYLKNCDGSKTKIGRIYHKENTGLFHITDVKGKHLEGQLTFEAAFLLLTKK